jgi:hypothetical protein
VGIPKAGAAMNEEQLRAFMAELYSAEEMAKELAAASQPKCKGLSTHCVDYIQALTQANLYHQVFLRLDRIMREASHD